MERFDLDKFVDSMDDGFDMFDMDDLELLMEERFEEEGEE